MFQPTHNTSDSHIKYLLSRCFYSLTALLGDFSNGADIPLDNPQAPIVPRHSLHTFCSQYPPIGAVLSELSAEFVKSINTYRHRRSPSPSVVTKLRGILRTLEVWNEALGDSTFTEPTTIIRTWLSNVSVRQHFVSLIQP
jgi:hypothetical protein